jgi:hypothetical protein
MDVLYVSPQGEIDASRRWNAQRPTAILPGSFNPLHDGHRGLAAVAAEILGLKVAFELSVVNVDKPPLSPDEMSRRMAQFAGCGALWLTNAPRFMDKADAFPGAVFVVGADTAQRLVDPRYYGSDPKGVNAALAQVRRRGCRFLVACRVDGNGRCVELGDVLVPRTFTDLFTAIPAERFRFDVSSTAIRTEAVGRVS